MGYPKETKGYYFYNASKNKENLFPKELVIAQCNLKKFKTQKLALYQV